MVGEEFRELMQGMGGDAVEDVAKVRLPDLRICRFGTFCGFD